MTAAFALMGLSNAQANESAFDFSFEALNSQDTIHLSAYQGHALLVVNTASACGFTGQYEGLEHLYQKYKDRGFAVIAVPSNDFGGQEPGWVQYSPILMNDIPLNIPLNRRSEALS